MSFCQNDQIKKHVYVHKSVVWSPELENNFGFQISQHIIMQTPFEILVEATMEAKIEGTIFMKFSTDHQ